MYIWFNNKMILLLLVGLGDWCVWIIWFIRLVIDSFSFGFLGL